MQQFLRISSTTFGPRTRPAIAASRWSACLFNSRECPSVLFYRTLSVHQSTQTTTQSNTGKVSPGVTSSKLGTVENAPYVVTRGPVSWAGLGLAALLAASAVGYYKIERERRLENAMGKIVSSESGWSPNPELFAPRKYLVRVLLFYLCWLKTPVLLCIDNIYSR